MNEEKLPLVVLSGPTAVGKTSLSIALAKAVSGEIISADSMQVYRHMDIGSAKITTEEMCGVPHHLIDVLDPTEDFHIVLFQQMAKKAMEEIYNRNHIPILVGGTGFYIQAVTKDIDFTEAEQDTSIRRELEDIAEKEGSLKLHQMLQEVDPKSAMEIHPNNVKRVIRALEFYQQNKSPISAHNEEQRENTSPYNLAHFVLNAPRDLIYQRIDQRVDLMLEMGLVDEVKKLKAMGCRKGMVSMQGLGYKEILDYLDNELSYEEAVRILKRDTRHFAKRQLTWFRRETDIIWINKEDYQYDDDKILSTMTDLLKEKNIIGNS